MSGHSFADSKYRIAHCTTRGLSILLPYLSPRSFIIMRARYTSLGSTYNTFRNPALLVHEETDVQAQSREYHSE